MPRRLETSQMAAVGSTRRGRYYRLVIARYVHHVAAKLLGWLGNFPWGQSANPVLSSLLPHRSLLLRCTQAIPEPDPSPLNSIISLVHHHHVPPQPLIRPSSFFPFHHPQGHCLVSGVRFFHLRAPFWSDSFPPHLRPFCLETASSFRSTRNTPSRVLGPFPDRPCLRANFPSAPTVTSRFASSFSRLSFLIAVFFTAELRVLHSHQPAATASSTVIRQRWFGTSEVASKGHTPLR